MRAADMRLTARLLANSSPNDLEALALPSVVGRLVTTPPSTRTNMPAINHSAGWKPTSCSSTPPAKKLKPFIAFFEPVNHATHRNNCPAPPSEVALIADFEAVFVMSLATPETP